MYLNRTILIGQIATDPNLRERDDKKTNMLDFRLRVLRKQWKHEQMTIRVVVFGLGAVAFNEHKKKGDYVVVSGRLCQRKFEGREGTNIEHHYVVAEDFRFLWGPPGKFIKDHVLVPRDQWERWRALEEEISPFYVPKKAREKLLGEGCPPLGDYPDNPIGTGNPENSKLHREWLEELDKTEIDMPGGEGFDAQQQRGVDGS